MTAKTFKFNDVLIEMIVHAESRFGIELVLDRDILREVEAHAKKHINSLNLDKPNSAKVASAFSFWFRKLKPIHHSEKSNSKYLLINEYIALMVGLSICVRKDQITGSIISERILYDWVTSFRYNSHSPSSSMLSFEVILDSLSK